jgi:hypothetical protein
LSAVALALTVSLQAAALRTTVDLAGEWRFALDRAAEQRTGGATGPANPAALPPGDGMAQEWFKRDLADKIKLPGILQAQGYGNDIATDTPWVLTLGDAWWKLQPAALRAHFSQSGHVEVPFLAQPPKHYLGVAWYQRDVDIPADQQGRHFVLFLERAHWQTTVWLDDKSFPANDSLVAPHVVDLGLVAPGKHRLTIRVDNRTQLAAAGHLVDGHAVSDGLGAAWNGIVGRIELQSTPPVWIEDVQAFPNVAKNSVQLKVKIGNATGQPGAGSLTQDVPSVFDGSEGRSYKDRPRPGDPSPVTWDATGGTGELTVPLAAGGWDEFHPSTYRLQVSLQGPGAGDMAEVHFGLREVTASGKDLLVNGRSVNLRLTHFGGDFPLTGYPAMDVASWQKIIQACKDHGLNGIRFHSWCPPEAAFTAADELGFYLQPECGMWNALSPNTPMGRRLDDETARLVQAYGNHPSFLLLSPSNEPSGRYQQVTPQWAAAWYAKDNRRLYSAGTGWADPSQVTGGAQFATLVRYGNGQLRNITGWFGKDYGAALTNVNIPVLAHEVGQWCAYPDFDVMKKFTGYLQPGNYDIFRYIAEQNGVLDENHALANASGKFQLACYKEEIEANLRTPGLAGFQLLDLHDYLGQGTALIGVLDTFWESKGYVTPAEFHRFAGPVVPLARLTQRIFTTAETLDCAAELYNYGDGPLPAAKSYWKITDAAGHTVEGGQWEPRDLPRGKNIPLGQVSTSLAALPAPAAYQLVVGVEGKAENDWNFWLYPAAAPAASAPADVLVTSAWADAETRLAAGGKVLFTPRAADLDAAKSPPMKDVPVFWNIQMTVRPPNNPAPKFDAMLGLLCDAAHPALAEFPTATNCDWQWTPLVNNVRSVNLTGAPRELRPIVAAIDDWNRNWRLGVIFECKVGPGRLLTSAINLDNARGGPGLAQLRRSLLDYVAGEKFQPTAALTVEQVRALWKAGAASAAPTAQRAFDPDLNDGTVPVPPAGG